MRQKDIFDLNWSDPSIIFYRTEAEDEIRNQWDEEKSELTKSGRRDGERRRDTSWLHEIWVDT